VSHLHRAEVPLERDEPTLVELGVTTCAGQLVQLFVLPLPQDERRTRSELAHLIMVQELRVGRHILSVLSASSTSPVDRLRIVELNELRLGLEVEGGVPIHVRLLSDVDTRVSVTAVIVEAPPRLERLELALVPRMRP
jgi:hypothetical protein